jgi:hypothetical protein
MNPRYAILQSELEPLDFEKLRRAFRGVPGLTAYDVDILCHEGGGVVGRNFSADQAMALQANLKGEGVPVEIVEESRLPVPPPGKTIHRVQLTPEALLVDDLLKGTLPIPWQQVSLIAAGSVQLRTISRQEKVSDQPFRLRVVQFGLFAIPETQPTVEYSRKESADWFLRAQIILQGGTAGYSIEAENFNFAPLGEGVTRDLAGNFCLLVRGLAAHAPQAVLGRGAASILSDPCEFGYYPNKNAFHDEIVWMLWRARQSAA